MTERQLIKNGDTMRGAVGVVTVTGLSDPTDVVVSADGRFVYTVGSGNGGAEVLGFRRDTATGQLTQLIESQSFTSATSLALRDNGTELVIVGTDLIVMSIANSGKLDSPRATSTNDLEIGSFDRVFTSGNFIYATNAAADALLVFNADTLERLDKVVGADNGLNGVSGIAKYGDFVYVTGYDGASLAVFRQAADGKLTLIEKFVSGREGVRGLAGADEVIVTPAGGYVIVNGQNANGLAVFQRNNETGRLVFVQTLRNNILGAAGLLAPTSMQVTSDGTKLFVGSFGDPFIGLEGGLTSFNLGLFVLDDPTANEAALEAVRSGSNLTAPVTLNFLLDTVPVIVNLQASSFSTSEALLVYIQTQVDAAVLAAGKATFGGIVVRFDRTEKLASSASPKPSM